MRAHKYTMTYFLALMLILSALMPHAQGSIGPALTFIKSIKNLYKPRPCQPLMADNNHFLLNEEESSYLKDISYFLREGRDKDAKGTFSLLENALDKRTIVDLLRQALNNKCDETAACLVDNVSKMEININILNDKDFYPLHEAFNKQMPQTIKALLIAGIDLYVVDRNDETIFDRVAHFKRNFRKPEDQARIEAFAEGLKMRMGLEPENFFQKEHDLFDELTTMFLLQKKPSLQQKAKTPTSTPSPSLPRYDAFYDNDKRQKWKKSSFDKRIEKYGRDQQLKEAQALLRKDKKGKDKVDEEQEDDEQEKKTPQSSSEYQWTLLLDHLANKDLVKFKKILNSYPELYSLFDDNNNNLLHLAVQAQANDFIIYLLKKRHNPAQLMCQLNKDGKTPLMKAAAMDSWLIVTYLLCDENNVNNTNFHNKSALWYALRAKQWKSVSMLISYGATPTAPDELTQLAGDLSKADKEALEEAIRSGLAHKRRLSGKECSMQENKTLAKIVNLGDSMVILPSSKISENDIVVIEKPDATKDSND